MPVRRGPVRVVIAQQISNQIFGDPLKRAKAPCVADAAVAVLRRPCRVPPLSVVDHLPVLVPARGRSQRLADIGLHPVILGDPVTAPTMGSVRTTGKVEPRWCVYCLTCLKGSWLWNFACPWTGFAPEDFAVRGPGTHHSRLRDTKGRRLEPVGEELGIFGEAVFLGLFLDEQR